MVAGGTSSALIIARTLSAGARGRSSTWRPEQETQQLRPPRWAGGTGLDLTSELFDVARSGARVGGWNIDWVEGDAEHTVRARPDDNLDMV
jgi:hypothetical protein